MTPKTAVLKFTNRLDSKGYLADTGNLGKIGQVLLYSGQVLNHEVDLTRFLASQSRAQCRFWVDNTLVSNVVHLTINGIVAVII